MGSVLKHRGPDDEGHYESNDISLGMRRLAIVDIETGYQPVSNEDKTIFTVCNGEIYNHKALRKELEEEGHIFHRSHSDIETIVHLYEHYKFYWVQKTNGMFGAAVWDKKNRTLSLYRDRIGKKPLYYSIIGRNIIFASEIKSLLCHPDISTELDFTALYHYFSNKNISAPRTCYKNIKELEPGHFLVWKNGTVTIHSYWEVNFCDQFEQSTESEIASQLYNLYVDAINLRIDCDVPFGAYLSGGVDSSSVVAIMSKMVSKPVKTFCLGYEEKGYGQFHGKQQDFEFARKMSKHLHTEHHELVINSDDFIQYIPEIIQSFDAPFSGTISTFFLSQLIKKYVKVALSGDGADELFGSYLPHRLSRPMSNFFKLGLNSNFEFHNLTGQQKAALHPFSSEEQFIFLKDIASPDLANWRQKLSVFSSDEKQQLLSPDFIGAVDPLEIGNNIYKILEPTLSAVTLLDKNLEIDQKELLPNQVLPFVDRLSMAHSIEVRCPFLDYRVIEFANRIPSKLKISGDIVKKIHKEAVKDILPGDIIERPKEGFVQPIYSWMHTSLKKNISDSILKLPSEYFNKEFLYTTVKKFNKGNTSLNAKIWNLYCFGIWFRQIQGK